MALGPDGTIYGGPSGETNDSADYALYTIDPTTATRTPVDSIVLTNRYTDLTEAPVPPPTCTETGYGKYTSTFANCFNDLDIGDFKNWGWSNGTLAAGTHEFELWAGAAQCDPSKGTLVGTVTVNYDGSTAIVTFDADSPYSFKELHLYVGSDEVAKDKKGSYTVAPGQFP